MIREEKKIRDEVVKPPEDKKVTEIKPSKVKTFKEVDGDLVEVKDAEEGNQTES